MSRKYATRFVALAGLFLALTGCEDIEADMKQYIRQNKLSEAKAGFPGVRQQPVQQPAAFPGGRGLHGHEIGAA